jgi:isopentenyl phosphate kinase
MLGTDAGSYAHVTARKYDLSKGARTDKQRYGMCVTHNGVRQLNAMVSDILVAKEVPAFGLSPADFITMTDGVIKHAHIEPIQHLLKRSCVPVVHGDTILDAVRGTTILSTENVFNACLAALKGDYKHITVIYAMNEDGVLDISGNVIPELSVEESVVAHDVTGHDVTGSILGKVQGAREALQFADVVYIVNASTRGSIQKAMGGGLVGTKVTR